MTGIIGAMEIETDGLIRIMTDSVVKSEGSYHFVKGKICGKEAVVCRCGIG